MDAQTILKRLEQLKGDRANWDALWSRIARRVWPDADEFQTKRAKGEDRSRDVYDSTAALALEKFAASMESMLTPRQQKWHRLRSTDVEVNDTDEAKEWFDLATRTMFAMRNSPRSGFYTQKHEGYKSHGAFGGACLFVGEMPDGSIRYRNIHIGQVYAAVDEWGNVDTIFRVFSMTAKAALQMWGDRAPEKVRQAMSENPFKEFEFVHAVIPRMDWDPERADEKGMRWESYYVSVQDRVTIESGGYHEMPYMYSRYTISPNEVYGRSPAMLVLPDILTLQEMEKVHLRSGHKIADPPLLVHDDGVLGVGSSSISIRPGGINYGGLNSQGQELIKPLQTGARLDITEAMMERKRFSINDAFLVTLFQILVERPEMTATEALLRAQEKGQLLAPTVGRQQSEALGPMIERELAILIRNRMLPPPPNVLLDAGGGYEIEYESPIHRMQRSEELIGIQRTLEIAAPFLQLNPSHIEIFDAEEVIRLGAEINGAPYRVIRSREKMKEIRAAQAEQAQAEQEQDSMVPAAKAAREMAQAGVLMDQMASA